MGKYAIDQRPPSNQRSCARCSEPAAWSLRHREDKWRYSRRVRQHHQPQRRNTICGFASRVVCFVASHAISMRSTFRQIPHIRYEGHRQRHHHRREHEHKGGRRKSLFPTRGCKNCRVLHRQCNIVSKPSAQFPSSDTCFSTVCPWKGCVVSQTVILLPERNLFQHCRLL